MPVNWNPKFLNKLKKIGFNQKSYFIFDNQTLAMHLLYSRKSHALLLALMLFGVLASCKKDKPDDPINPPQPPAPTGVSVDLSTVPYPKLSDYRFFVGDMKDQNPAEGVLFYEPITPLFTDYASKKRFVWMPSGSKANYISDTEILDLPVGSAIIKTFYYDHMLPSGTTKILETRIMIRKSSGWIFAEYVWNDEQTEAYLDMDGSFQNISFLHDGTPMTTNYRLPSSTECLICHKFNTNPIPIGIKPQHLNKSVQYADGSMNQLQKWVNVGYLNGPVPSNILTVVDYKDTSKPLRDRVRSYLDMNCAHCHQANSHCDYRPMRLAYSETALSVNLGVCVTPDEFIEASLVNIITPGNINKSMMHYRLGTTEESSRMPLLGRSLVHQEGLDLLGQYILSISNCD
jgi:uncharacterized repeat protein (TIGR03806 family)